MVVVCRLGLVVGAGHWVPAARAAAQVHFLLFGDVLRMGMGMGMAKWAVIASGWPLTLLSIGLSW